MEKLAVLSFAQVLLKVHVQGRTTCQMLDIWLSVQLELVYHIERIIFNNVKIAVVTVARHLIAIFLVPLCVLDTDILCRNHFAVEHKTFLLVSVFLVGNLNHAKNVLYE